MCFIRRFEKNDKSQYLSIGIAYLLVFLFSVFTAKILSASFWPGKMNLLHTTFELVCTFLAFSTFLTVWYTYPSGNYSNRIIGFGFFAVTIFNIMHIYYFPAMGAYPEGYYDLSVRFWILGSLTQAITLLISASNLISARVNKWILLITSVAASVGLSMALIKFQGAFPALANKNGTTSAKVIIEYFLVCLYAVGFIRLTKKFKRMSISNYRYICLAILTVIPAEICLALYESFHSIEYICGHILKLFYFYFILKGIFTRAVILPYTALEKRMDKLLESKHELWHILNSLPLALLKYDNDLRVSFANKKAFELLECKPEEIMGENLEYIENKLGIENNKTIEQIFDKQTSKANYLRKYKTFKGNDIRLSIDAFRYKSGVLSSFSDAKKDQELSELKIQTRTILNAISNSVIVTDVGFKILVFNKAFKVCIEMRDKEILGKNLNLLYEELQMKVNGIPIKAEATKEKNEKFIEAAFVTPRNNKKIILLNSNPIFNVQDEVIGYIFVSSDITELKKEHQKALRQEKLAIVGQMGSGIVHETKNHLAAIKGYCQLLEQKVSGEQVTKYIKRIEAISDDVNRVIIDFLSLAKPTETIMDIISLNETINSLRYILDSPSFMRGVKINIKLSEQERDIKADETQIKQVLINMAKNAIEAMAESDNPVMEITTDACDEKKQMMLIISDSGKGISKENMSKIGSLFFTTKENGTGIGLNLCYRIIKEHGGNIELYSEEGKGTTFRISIPYYDD